MNGLLDLLRDARHIVAKAPDTGASRLALFRAYLNLKRLRNDDSGEVSLLGYRVRYLDAKNFAQLFREIFVDRLYFMPLETDAPRIIDCGSNIGMSILFFKNLYPSSEITAFEPNPLSFPTLRLNIERNGFRDVVLNQLALSDRAGTLQFYVQTDQPGALHTGLYPIGGTTEVNVQAAQLSSYIETEIDLLKLDIEGAEELVLRDLAEHDKLRSVRNLVCEYHHHHRREDGADRLSRALRILEDAGFTYQLDAYCGAQDRSHAYQDILVYASRKGKK